VCGCKEEFRLKEKGYTNFETATIHGGYDSRNHIGSLTPPIYQSSTFTFLDAEQGERRFSGDEGGHIYTRLANPTVQILEDRIAMLEGGEKGLAFSSGMAAVSAVLFSLLKTGDHLIASKGIYGCTFGLLSMLKEKFEVDHDFSTLESEEAICNAMKPNTRVIYIESPINPTMKLIDLKLVVKMAKEKDVLVVVDNTFCSPYLQQPLLLGCDVVIHSATKYIGGHGDVIAGLVVAKSDLIEKIQMTTRKDIGATLSPFDAWLLLRGLKTLHVRMDRHCENASKIAEKLRAHDRVETIYYPGDRGHSDYHIMKKQMENSGGILAFTIKGDKQDAQKFINELKLIKIAVSLGDAESLIQHPSTMTHSVIPLEQRLKMGITDNMLRLSVGLEAWEDIWDDLLQALNKLA